VPLDDRKTLEVRYSLWRLLRYGAVSGVGVALAWYLIDAECHWASCILGWLALPVAGISLADALWRLWCYTRGPDLVLSLDGVGVYGAQIPWSAVHYTTAKRDLGMSTIELHFFPGAGDDFQFDFVGRIARWMSTGAGNDGIVLSAFALQIGHEDLAALIDAYRAEDHRRLNASEG
jgi:hypothetical protein